MTSPAPTSTPVQLNFNVDGLENTYFTCTKNEGASLKMLFATAAKADAFFKSCRSPNGDPFCCEGPDGHLFSWSIGTPTIKVSPVEDSAVQVDTSSPVRTFHAAYVNCRADQMHPSQEKLVTYLKFISNPE